MDTGADCKDMKHLVAAFYKFVRLDNHGELRAPLQDVCSDQGITGTILLAQEGINGTIAGSREGIAAVFSWLGDQPGLDGIGIKYSEADEPPFLRMKVRLKKEIVTLGVDDIDPEQNAGTYVQPEDWNDLISDPDVVLVDTRNAYEVAIGTFEGATDPATTSFRELPQWVDENLQVDPDTKIAMFCTGGIRCEKSTAFLKSKGFTNVYHLDGGILRYLENVEEADSMWRGECFVFDQRVSVGHGLKPGQYDLCHACRMPISEDEKTLDAYQPGVSCPHCIDSQNERQRQRYADRQKQMELAKARNEPHLAADISEARNRKRDALEEQRARSQTPSSSQSRKARSSRAPTS